MLAFDCNIILCLNNKSGRGSKSRAQVASGDGKSINKIFKCSLILFLVGMLGTKSQMLGMGEIKMSISFN